MRDVLVELAGHLVGALPVAEDGPEDEQDDEAADDDAGRHHPRVQLEGVLALLGRPSAGAVAGVEAAPAEDQGAPMATDQRRRRHRRGRPGSIRASGVGSDAGPASGRPRPARWRRTVCECVHGDDTSGHRQQN